MMETIFRWSSSRPRTMLVLVVLLCLGFSGGISLLRIDASIEHLLSERDPRVIYRNNVRENFGDRPVLLLLAESPDLFKAETLLKLRKINAEFTAVKGVTRTSNLFETSVPVSRGGKLGAEPLLREIPSDSDALAKLRDSILANELLRDHLLNSRGDAMLFLYFLESASGSEGNHPRILGDFAEILSAHREGSNNPVSLTLVGSPSVKHSLEKHLEWDLGRLAPIAMLVIGILIFAFYRSLIAVFLPLLTGVLSCVATLGFMGFAGFEISVFLSTILVLILVLGCCEDLHILSEYFDNLSRGMSRPEAICKAGASTGTALLLTSLTTVLGFVSIMFTDITGLRHFAISSAFGLALNFLITVLVLPAMLALLPIPRHTRLPDSGLLARTGRLLENAFLHHRPAMVFISVGILLVSGAGIVKLVTDTDYLRFFSRESEVVKTYERFNTAFGGTGLVTVTFETGRHEGVIAPENLARFLTLHEYLERECGSALDLVDLLNEVRKAEGLPVLAAESLPPKEELAAFLASLPRDILKPFLDFDGSRAAIRLRFKVVTSTEVLRLEEKILGFVAEQFGDKVEVRVTGDPIVIAHLCDVVTDQLVRNLVILALVVAFLISLIVRSFTQGVLAIIPNLFPIVTTFGAMGWLDIPLSIGTFPVANIAFGIAVDDTIHFLLRFNAERRRGKPTEEAILGSMRTELRPILATSMTVCGGYLVMTLSPLRINAEVGVLFALATLSAVVADLVLTPVLLRTWGKHRITGDL